MADENRNNDEAAEQLSLFEQDSGTEPQIQITCWRTVEEPDLAGNDVLELLTAFHLDFLRRNEEFLSALMFAGVDLHSPEVQQFQDDTFAVLANYAFLVDNRVQVDEARELLSIARSTEEELASARREILEQLPAQQLQRFLNAESAVSIPDATIESRLMPIVEHILMEIDLALEAQLRPAADAADPLRAHTTPEGIMLSGAIDSLVQMSTAAMRDEQEKKPLPARAGLHTLLKGLPVVWLDAVCRSLEVELDGNRSQREHAVAALLENREYLESLVANRLSKPERDLVCYLLDNDGRVKASSVTRKFGSDEEDGWFWIEQPPTSTLGRLRMNGLVYVGRSQHGQRMYRTAVVPKELRQPLNEILI
jgi:hypothetical protein